MFCSKPYFNEPGYEVRRGTQCGDAESQRYNAAVRRDTMHHALLVPLCKASAKPHHVFSEVLELHWRFKRSSIKLQLKAWAIDDQDRAIVRRISSILDELEAP